MSDRWNAVMIALAMLMWLTGATVGAGAATLVTARGYLDVDSGQVISPARVLVVDGRITALNPSQIPDGTEEVDLGDKILLPGLTDLHTHLTMDIEPGWLYLPVEWTAADYALRGGRNAHVTLQAGFTTVRDVGAPGFSDVALMRAIERGDAPGPRIVAAGHAISITGGHCDVTGFAPGVLETSYRDGVADGAAEIVKAVRYQIKHGAKVIKICATAGVLSFEGPVGAQQYSLDELKAAVEEANRHGLRTAAHAHGAAGIYAAVEAGVTTIEHGSILDDATIALMKKKGAWYIPQLYLIDAIDREQLPPPIRAKMDEIGPEMEGSFAKAMKAGLKIAFGTDAGVYPHGENAREFTARVAHGMSPLEAIRGATSYAADVLGVSDRGRIAPGQLADIIAVNGNPLDDISLLENVAFVMKDGKVYKNE